MRRVTMKAKTLSLGLSCTLAMTLATTLATDASAALLNGLLTIDPITYAEQEVLDDMGNPSTVSVYQGGSYFSMTGFRPNPNSATSITANGTPAGGMLLNTYQNFVLDPDEPHLEGWQGDINGDGIPDGAAGTGYSPTVVSPGLLQFSFFNVTTYVGTNPVGYQSGQSHAAPTIWVDFDDCTGSLCTMTGDLSSWEVMWNGSAFEQGPRPDMNGPFTSATGTYDRSTGEYHLQWTSQIKGGPFGGVTGYWVLEGQHVVPVPAALWLFGTGLVGLLGVGRKRRLKTHN